MKELKPGGAGVTLQVDHNLGLGEEDHLEQMLCVMCFLGPHRTHLVSGVDGEVDGAAVLDPHLGELGPILVQNRPLPGKICSHGWMTLLLCN